MGSNTMSIQCNPGLMIMMTDELCELVTALSFFPVVGPRAGTDDSECSVIMIRTQCLIINGNFMSNSVDMFSLYVWYVSQVF